MCMPGPPLGFIFAWLALAEDTTGSHDSLSNYVVCLLWFGLNPTHKKPEKWTF